MYDFQKANMWKRISAAIFDFIILVIFVLGFAWGLTNALNYSGHTKELQAHHDRVEVQYGIDFDISAEEYEALSAEEKARFTEADNVFRKDPAANKTYSIIFANINTVNPVLLACDILLFLGEYAFLKSS